MKRFALACALGAFAAACCPASGGAASLFNAQNGDSAAASRVFQLPSFGRGEKKQSYAERVAADNARQASAYRTADANRTQYVKAQIEQNKARMQAEEARAQSAQRAAAKTPGGGASQAQGAGTAPAGGQAPYVVYRPIEKKQDGGPPRLFNVP